jgi:hypothetical protein
MVNMATQALAYDKIISPQNYLQLVTGKCLAVNVDNQLEYIERVLAREGYELWNYPLNEMDEIMLHNCEDGTKYVLVEIVNITDGCKQEKLYRWFELPFENDVTEDMFE